ncbi:MAG: tetratricopeptide repeat protein [Chloroflexota bacterium]|nr:MAG: tetratricopeptide repeat protein [Chloroflexota bacterium]
MSLPLMAEGEFALLKDYLEVAGSKPVSAQGLLFHDTELYSMYLDSAVQQRDEVALRKYAPLAEVTAARDDHILHQASAHRAWGVLQRLQGEFAAAETRLHQALELFEGLETRWQIGRTYYEIAELALDQADPSKAELYFTRALDSFEHIGADPDAARTRQALESLLSPGQAA